jgi:hypothetical protein
MSWQSRCHLELVASDSRRFAQREFGLAIERCD